MNENKTLQEKLQVQERKENRIGKGIVIGAVILILLACAGTGVFKLRDWAAAQGEIELHPKKRLSRKLRERRLQNLQAPVNV